jgi:hypothetical protein
MKEDTKMKEITKYHHSHFLTGKKKIRRREKLFTLGPLLISHSVMQILKQRIINKSQIKKSYIFWDITPCSPLKFNRRFRETCRLHLQGPRKNQAINQPEAGIKHSNPSTLKMEMTCSSETTVDFKRASYPRK